MPTSGKNRVLLTFLLIVNVISCSHLALSQKGSFPRRIITPYFLDSKEAYWQTVDKDPTRQMILLKSIDRNMIFDLKYGTKYNFTGQVLYQNPEAYLRLPAALALKKVNDELRNSGLAIKVFDAYRPYSVTKKMWSLVRDHRYVANPAKGSGHNRGTSVDLTLVNLATKKELPMGTAFDDFTTKAGHLYLLLPVEVLHNRLLLKKVMQKHGFLSLNTEWWHYIYAGGKEKFELLNLGFDELKR